jgi:hypothetical protein
MKLSGKMFPFQNGETVQEPGQKLAQGYKYTKASTNKLLADHFQAVEQLRYSRYMFKME